mmetsp:Transcript_49013/g.158811  ORF Transcript_49013/g.158811 Transcript_49013/m.158811 type:complete len:173 (-) Transcript_49013:86-604(-)
MGGWRDDDAGMLERREAIDLAQSELDAALGEIAEAEQRSEPVALGPWLKRYFALARRSECGFSPFMVLLLLQCVESQSVEAASVYIASRALGRLNLARQAEERALGVPAAIELDRRVARSEAQLAQSEITSAMSLLTLLFGAGTLLSLAFWWTALSWAFDALTGGGGGGALG